MKFVWTRVALSDFNHAYEWIAEDRVSSAVQIINRIEEVTNALNRYPSMGRRGRVNGTHELVIAGTPFILVYRLKNKRIEVLSFLHTSRQWPDE